MSNIRAIRRDYCAAYGRLIDVLPRIRRATAWGECTAEAQPLARAHSAAEETLRAEVFGGTARIGLGRALALSPRAGRTLAVREALARLDQVVDGLQSAVSGWGDLYRELADLESARRAIHEAVDSA